MHAVLVTVIEDVEPAARFAEFLETLSPRFEARFATLEADRSAISKETHQIYWPQRKFDEPMKEESRSLTDEGPRNAFP